MAKTLGNLYLAYIRKYTIATLKILVLAMVVSNIARCERRPSSSATLRAAPIPRHVKATGPDIAPCGPGLGFVADVVSAVSAIRDGPPFTHEPAVKIDTVLMTDRNEAAKAVGIAHGATDLPAADPVGERQRRSLPASPALTLTALTDDGIKELTDMLRYARITTKSWHEFLDDFSP